MVVECGDLIDEETFQVWKVEVVERQLRKLLELPDQIVTQQHDCPAEEWRKPFRFLHIRCSHPIAKSLPWASCMDSDSVTSP
jgi:hypothetical protein